jgi:hypothetical protein
MSQYVEMIGTKGERGIRGHSLVTYMIMLDGVLGFSTRTKMIGNGFPLYLRTYCSIQAWGKKITNFYYINRFYGSTFHMDAAKGTGRTAS